MDPLFLVGLAILVIVIAFALFIVLVYNSLIVLRNRIENSLGQIDVQLKRRNDLIPNLVETVKGYAKHERKVFTDVTKARAAVMQAKNLAKKAAADNLLTSTLKSLFAVAENYPQLRANENFKDLQAQLTEVESKIAYARQFYNDTVLRYNNKIQRFPYNMIAGMFSFVARDFFKTAEAERKAPRVKF